MSSPASRRATQSAIESHGVPPTVTSTMAPVSVAASVELSLTAASAATATQS